MVMGSSSPPPIYKQVFDFLLYIYERGQGDLQVLSAQGIYLWRAIHCWPYKDKMVNDEICGRTQKVWWPLYKMLLPECHVKKEQLLYGTKIHHKYLYKWKLPFIILSCHLCIRNTIQMNRKQIFSPELCACISNLFRLCKQGVICQTGQKVIE